MKTLRFWRIVIIFVLLNFPLSLISSSSLYLANNFNFLTKSALKFIAYTKVLLQKLDINIKEHFDYKITKTVEKENSCSVMVMIIDIFLNFIPLMIYIIKFYAEGTFNENNIEKEYDKKKKNYVDIMDNYILLIYLVFFLIYYLLNILYNNIDKISLKNRQKFIIFIVVFFIELMYYITHIIKFYFTGKIIKKELMKKYKKKSIKIFMVL